MENCKMRIGVLGGIGPLSSVAFYKELINRIQNTGLFQSNCQYPEIMIENIPGEELTDFLPEKNKGKLQCYIKGLKNLVSLEPTFIVMVCNTIHVYYDHLIESVGFTNILSIRKLVYSRIKRCELGGFNREKICVLGTPTTIKLGLYDFNDFDYVALPKDKMRVIAQAVNDYTITGNKENNVNRLKGVIDYAQEKGANLFILACTEISLLLRSYPGILSIDPLSLLVDYSIAACVNDLANKAA